MDDFLRINYTPKFSNFYELMKFRITEILLVSSLYDAFVLEEDGSLVDKLFTEFIDLNLRFIPRITRVSSAKEAFTLIKKKRFDLVLITPHIPDMPIFDFGKGVKRIKKGLPVILLNYEPVSEEFLGKIRKEKSIDRVFYWYGDRKILLAIVKYVEDRKNLDNDTKYGVSVILLIEDSPWYYSYFFPILYREVLNQTRYLLKDSANELQKYLRIRARPKIILVDTYEEAIDIYSDYKKNLLGVISDVRFPIDGVKDDEAGFKFAELVKKDYPDIPFLIQSDEIENREKAYERNLGFLDKNSENLESELRQFLLNHFGFGDFVFKLPDGTVVGKAGTLREMIEVIKTIPDESLKYHSERNHFSIWLRARTEFELARRLRPKKVSDFSSMSELREYIIKEIKTFLDKRDAGIIADFSFSHFDEEHHFIKVGSGSLGGKGRSIAFLNALVSTEERLRNIKGITLRIPDTLVICTEVFERFIEDNNLFDRAIECNSDSEVAELFLNARFPDVFVENLKDFLRDLNEPIAVRSSSLLEDSQNLPFAGLYKTFMLPNNSPDFKSRFKQLIEAIKLVYASVFFQAPKRYSRNSNYRIEEEKMAVVIQKIVGKRYDDVFYPVISGVVQSFNYYPFEPLKPEDGVAHIALGLGKIVVDGGEYYSFSPKYPDIAPPYSSPSEFLKFSQKKFYALDMTKGDIDVLNDEGFDLRVCDLKRAERDGTLFFIGSTYDPQDGVIRDNVFVDGYRLITFAHILKYKRFPLAEILDTLMDACKKAIGTEVELEFAVDFPKERDFKGDFYLLQVRPMVKGKELAEVEISDREREKSFISSTNVLGNGVYSGINHIVFLKPERFSNVKTPDIASEVRKVNEMFEKEGKSYLLIGFGRWATSDRFLGVPVKWEDISKAKLIVESNLNDFRVDPSQGSHFFHNMITLNIGYFHIQREDEKNFIKWDFLNSLEVVYEGEFVKAVKMPYPFVSKINPRMSEGIVFTP